MAQDLGLIGGGYGDRDWLARQFDLAAGAPVGSRFITCLARQPRLLDLALQYEPVAVMLSFGDPAVFARHQVRRNAVGLPDPKPDPGQAGHKGRRRCVGGSGHGPVDTATVTFHLTLVPEIVDLVTARGTDIPVIAAGGIADGRGLAARVDVGRRRNC